MKTKEDYLLDIAVIGLPHISNFDDFDPLGREEGVRLRYVESGDSLGNPDLVILPGTKSTMADLGYLQRTGVAREILVLARNGTPVIGICGGYQMLGQHIMDPHQVESAADHVDALGLLPDKSTHQVTGRVVLARGILGRALDLPLKGYEIHMGQTEHINYSGPFQIDKRSGNPCQGMDGCLSVDGNILGTYIHGLFHNDGFRGAILASLAGSRGVNLPTPGHVFSSEEQYDKLAAIFRSSLDMDLIGRLLNAQP